MGASNGEDKCVEGINRGGKHNPIDRRDGSKPKIRAGGAAEEDKEIDSTTSREGRKKMIVIICLFNIVIV